MEIEWRIYYNWAIWGRREVHLCWYVHFDDFVVELAIPVALLRSRISSNDVRIHQKRR